MFTALLPEVEVMGKVKNWHDGQLLLLNSLNRSYPKV